MGWYLVDINETPSFHFNLVKKYHSLFVKHAGSTLSTNEIDQFNHKKRNKEKRHEHTNIDEVATSYMAWSMNIQSFWHLIESQRIVRSNKHKFWDAKSIYLRLFNFIYSDREIYLECFFSPTYLAWWIHRTSDFIIHWSDKCHWHFVHCDSFDEANEDKIKIQMNSDWLFEHQTYS